MGRETQLLPTQAPVEGLHTLSFCKPTAKDLAFWTNALPKANLGELARLLFQALSELNKLQVPAVLRFQLLEVIRPEINFITRQLEKNHLSKSIILDERGRKVANLCQALQNMLTTGYKLCVNEQKQQPKQRNSVLAYAIQRTIHSLYCALSRSYQLYYPVPAGLWFDLHQLYVLGCQHQLQQTLLKDSLLGNVKQQSIEQAYCCALLLGSARINQMHQNNIARLFNILPSWCQLATIRQVQAAGSLFVVCLNSDTPPRYKALLNLTSTDHMIGLDTAALVKVLDKWLSLPAQKRSRFDELPMPHGAQSDLVYQLCNAWGDIAKRDFNRTPGSGTMDVCLGMTAVHYYLADETPFDKTLAKPHNSKANYNYDNSTPDIWGDAFDAMGSGQDILDEVIEFTPQSLDPAQTPVHEHTACYPKYSTNIVNQSPGGYCLTWEESAPAQLQAGDIIGLNTNRNDQLVVAVIRWIRQIRNGGAQIGVELIAPNAQPCALQLLRAGQEPSNYLRALLIPEIPAISRPASLLTPQVPFAEASRVNINHAGDESRATLTKRLLHTSSISQYEYKLAVSATLKPTEDNSAASLTTAGFTTIEAKPAKASDDFDSLWKIL